MGLAGGEALLGHEQGMVGMMVGGPGVVPVGGVGIRVGPLAWPFPVEGMGGLEGVLVREVWSAGPRYV